MLFCVNVHVLHRLAHRPHGSCKRSGWKCKSKNATLAFLCGQWICILSISMTPFPYPLTSSLRPLNPAMFHINNNNNNNGGLHACVRAAEDIEPFLQLARIVVKYELQQQFDFIIGTHKRFWFPCTTHFRLLLVVFGFSLYCLFVYSAQALSAFSTSSSPFLVNFNCHL